MYNVKAKIWLEKDGHFVMGEGRAELLRLIEKSGSITTAAETMGMSYRHAWGVIKRISNSLGGDVVKSERGGREGGRSDLTSLGREALREYERYNAMMRSLLGKDQPPRLAVDGIASLEGKLVSVRRKYPPFRGHLALPGGMVEHGETVEQAVSREVREETGLDVRAKRIVGVYSDPRRDPRGHVISVAFEVEILGGKLKSGSDAESLELIDFNKASDLAFDHSKIVEDYLSSR